jgi:hypothetical protein
MISNYTANKIINAFRGTTWTGETALYLSFHTAHPGRTGANEFAGGSYARELIQLDAPTNGVTQNTDAESATMSAQTAKFWGLWNAVTGGDFLIGGPCTEQTFTDGQTAELADGDLDVVL